MKKVLIGTGSAEIVEKKSRFIANAFQVRNEAEAAAIIEKQKKKYWDARHNCYAFICGAGGELQRSSDDGEPSGTAGRPILEALNGAQLTNILVVVTRYFGGILLGTGGLVRAYSGATAAVIKELAQADLSAAETEKLLSGEEEPKAGFISEVGEGISLSFSCGYKDIGRIENLLAEKNIPVFEKEYGENVSITAALRTGQADSFKKAALDATSGSISYLSEEDIFFGTAKGRAFIYEF